MPPTQHLIDAFNSVPPVTIAKYAGLGAVIGMVVVPLLVYAAIKTNYKKLRDVYAATRIPQTWRFYRLFAFAGAAVFAILGGSQPLLDAAGKDEVWIRGALIPVIMIAVGIPFVRALRRQRDGR